MVPAMLVGLPITFVMISTTTQNVSLMVVTVAKKIPQKDGTIIAKNVNVLMPLNQQLKLQWSAPFPNGPVTISVMTKTTTPSVDLMEEIVVITKWRATPTIAVLANAWNTQSQLKNLELTVLPHTGLEMPSVMTKTTPKNVDLMVE